MGSITSWAFFYRVQVETLKEWANATNFMTGGLRFSVEEPEITTNFRYFLLIMYGKIWEKRIFRYITMVIEQLKALITSFCKLTDYHRTQWAERFDSWPHATLRVQLDRLVESGGFLEIEWAPLVYFVGGVELAHITLVFWFSVCSAI